MDKNLTDFFKSIEELSTTNSVTSYIPSTSKEVTLQPLTLKQQKDIIASQIVGVVGLVRFGRVLNDILLESSKCEDLLVCDKAPLAISLRINSISDKIGDVDLTKILNQFRSDLKLKMSDTIEDNGIVAEVAIPTLLEENKIIAKLESLIDENEDDVAINISNIYIFEVVKYIKSLSIKDVKLVFDEIPNIYDRVSILEKLPLSINKKIVDYIEYNKLREREALTWGEETVEISAEFFDFE
jgi:hypothetical protein